MTIGIIVVLIAVIGYLVHKLYTVTNGIKNLSHTSIQIGRVSEYTKHDEDLLATQKEALKYVVKYMEYKLAIVSEGLTDYKKSEMEIRAIQKSVIHLVELRNNFQTLLNRKIDLK